jgi:uncharacterized short protein YbdD (DUF466 family)
MAAMFESHGFLQLIPGKDSDSKNGLEIENALARWFSDNIAQELNYQVTWAAATRAAKVLKSWWGPWTTEDYNAYVEMVKTEHPGLTPLDYDCWVEWRRAEFETQEGWGHPTYSRREDIVDSALRGGHVNPKTTPENIDDWEDRYVSHYPDNCVCGDNPHLGRISYKHTVEDGCTGPMTLDQMLQYRPDWRPIFGYEMGEPDHGYDCLCNQWLRRQWENREAENVD